MVLLSFLHSVLVVAAATVVVCLMLAIAVTAVDFIKAQTHVFRYKNKRNRKYKI